MTDATQDDNQEGADGAEARPEGYVDLTAQPAAPAPAGDGGSAPVTFEPMIAPPAPSDAGAAAGEAPLAPPAPSPVPSPAPAAVPAPPEGATQAAPGSATVAAPTIPADGDGADGSAGDGSKAGDDERVLKSPFPLPDLREGDDDDDDIDASRDEFTTVYDIIDRLEAVLEEAKGSIFFPDQVKIDRAEFAGQLSDLKKMLPVQLERASALMREAERRLEGAQTQANAIVASAQSRAADIVKEANEQAQFLAGQENVTEIARQKARTILNTAQTKADRLTRGADEYSTKVMESLRSQLAKMSGDVDAGLNVLYERRKSADEQMPHLDISDYPESR